MRQQVILYKPTEKLIAQRELAYLSFTVQLHYWHRLVDRYCLHLYY